MRSALDNSAILADMDINESDQRKRREFYAELEQYYRRKWNATLKIPYVNGRPVDFYALFNKVTALGGWTKVSTLNRWKDVLDAVYIPQGCAASEHAVKSIYMRYLAKFEQSQLFGETDGDNIDGPNSTLTGRSQRGRSYLSSLGGQAGVSSYPRFASSALPDIPSSSIGRSNYSQCGRLIQSLKSGLPNEVDFTVNVCMILSSPPATGACPFTLRLNDTPILIDLLLAHAGVFGEGLLSLRPLYESGWKCYTPGRDFDRFWLNCMDQDNECARTLFGLWNDDSTDTVVTNSLFTCLDVTPNDLKIMTKRVEQIAHIMRNFSFESDSRSALASSRTMVKYLLMAINSRNIALQSLALDTLSNITSEMILDEVDAWLLRMLMNTLTRCLHSEDKFHIIRALESIGNLCSNEKNELLLCDYLEPVVIRRLIALLAVKDIMMCVYLLECLYQMTEIGPIPCQRLAEVPRTVDTLVQLITVEAVGFGPSGLFGMKVVEYGLPHPQTAILAQPPKPSAIMPNAQLASNSVFERSLVGSPAVRLPRPIADPTTIAPNPMVPATPPQPPPFLARPVRPVIADGQTSAPTGQARVNGPTPAIQQPTPSTSPSKKDTAAVKSKVDGIKMDDIRLPVVPSTHRGPAVNVQQDQHVEQLTMNWLRQNCTNDPTSRVSRGELYASYVQDMRFQYDSMAVSVSVFTNYVRQTFPSCTVRQLDVQTNANAAAQTSSCRGTLLQFDGLKFSPKTPLKNSIISPSSSSCSSTSPPLSQLAAQHPLMQQILSSGSTPEKQTASPIQASPIAVKNTTASAIRARSNSVGTMDSIYSMPGTPDSLSSGFSGTNNSSSVGQCGPTNFAAAGLQQQQINSPNAPKKRIVKKAKIQTGTPISGTIIESNGMVNGFNSNSAPSPTAICHLEVCHPAQEARAVIETGDNHEARIVRVENTIAMVSSRFYVPDESTTQKVVNGTINAGDNTNSDNSRDVTTSNSSNHVESKKSTRKKPVKKNSTTTIPLNGLVKSSAGEATSNSVISSGSSPSPDMETMKQNVTQSIQSIQELLAGNSNQSKEDKEETNHLTDSPAKTTPKRTGRRRKSQPEEVAADGSEAPPPPKKKKKYYPKKKKTAVVAVEPAPTPVPNLNDSLSQASTSSSQSRSTPPLAGATPFRLPMTPIAITTTATQSPQIQQQSATTNGSPMILRVQPPSAGQLQYYCEWDGCGKSFATSNSVYYHVAKTHINDDVRVCHWSNCDATVRLRWSLIAHVQDIHCNEQSLRTAAARRLEISACGHSNIPEPRPPPPHPGYPPDAAIVAIRRHSLVNLTKEVVDESEGPVTKSIRLTSSLILRNLARYSPDGRRVLRKYERMLAYLAFSRLESTSALAQCLAELTNTPASTSPFKP